MHDDHDDIELDEWIGLTDNAPMSALFGDVPHDQVFTGAITGRMAQAAANDAIKDLKREAARDPDGTQTLNDLISSVATFASLQMARRIALEMKGCTINPDHRRDSAEH